MRLSFSFALGATLASSFLSSALGNQVPVVNGVIGGVPEASETPGNLKVQSPQATTPGKLRVTENSGVCGMTPLGTPS